MEKFVALAGAHSSSQKCHLCHSKSSSMNKLDAIKTRQTDAENVKLGISRLHDWIKCFESLLAGYHKTVREEGG
ncbi:hypothetical protein TNCT_288021 [Trichonephila clavata]|uniref:Uncharacterized protein n=1 Tax=Trichonephila clavata TaxID=2740835 RepID=A0A8X6F9W8_TRICU|nr:hypothetical protein TNCT_288021 [Trichonephila clavata]